MNISSEWGGNTRFADASITTSGGVTNTSVTVTVTIGRRRASASTNVLDDASLKRTVELAATLAKLSPEDPELMPELGPQTYGTVNAFVQRTASLDPEVRSGAVSRAVEAAAAAGKPAGQMFTAGFLEANARAVAVATSAGLFAYHRTTDADFSVTARTPDGTGQRMGDRRRARLGPGRSGGDRPHRRAESRGQPQSASDRAGPVHGSARAVGRHRSRAAAERRAQRAHAPTKGGARSRSPAAARASAKR